MMPRNPSTIRAAALAAAGAIAAAVVIATASAAADTPASTTTARGPMARTAASATASVRVGSAAAVGPTSTAQGFLGIATELNTITALSGPAADPDTPFVNLLRNLSPGAPFLLRLGGTSGDDSWWPVPGVEERWAYRFTPRWGADVQALIRSLGGKAIIGVTLKDGPKNDAKIAPAEVADFNRYLGSNLIDAFELGNEPEFYPPFVVDGGRGHVTIADYGKLFSNVASELGGAPLAGPGSGSPNWLPKLGTMLGDMSSRLKLVTVHAYPMKNCSGLAHLSVSDFFASASIQGLADSIHAMVKAAAARGEPLRVDEINGVSCGGDPGLSDSFGEALWALNVLPALWQAGVQGVNFQTVASNYNFNRMITAKDSASGWRVSVEPEYYGLLAFADAAPAGSHLLRTSGSGLPGFFQFAVRAPNGSERVVLTNVGSVARTIGLTAPGTRGTGSLSLLSANSLSATSGTKLAGQTLSPRTGKLTGTPRLTRVRPTPKGVYTVQVPAHSAAILTLPG